MLNCYLLGVMNMINKIKNYFKTNTLTFVCINIYLLLLLVLPKNVNLLFNFIPIRLAAVFLLFAAFLFEIVTHRIQIRKFNLKIFAIIYFVFLLSTIPSILVSKHIVTSIYTLIKFISYFMLIVVMVTYPFEKKEFKFLIKNLVFSTIVVTLLGLAQYIFEFDLNLNGLDKYPDIRGRIPSTFFNPIYLGVYINIVFIYLLTFLKEKLLNRKLAYVLLLGLYTILVLTFTRSAILVFCGILFLTLIFNYKLILNKFTASLLVLCVAITLLIPGAKNVNFNSFENGFNMIFKSDFMSSVTFGLFDGIDTGSDKIETFEDASLEHRKQFAIIAKRIAKDNPLTGVGFGTYIDYMDSEDFTEAYPDYTYSHTHPHSGFVLLAAETGYISTALFILSIAVLALYLLKEFIIRFKNKGLDYKLSLCILCVSAGFVITCIIAENLFYDTQIFPIYIFVIMLTYNFICAHKIDTPDAYNESK